MSKNVSHVVIHHHYDNEPSSTHTIGMTYCIAFSAVIVIILLIILVFVVYIVIQKTKCKEHCGRPPLDTLESTCRTQRAISNNYKEESHNRRLLINPSAAYDNCNTANSNLHSVRMSSLRDEMQVADNSDSSAGLCEVLFPPKDDQEVIYENPSFKVHTVKYQKSHRSNTRASSDPVPSCSRSASTNESLDWDNYETRRYQMSSTSGEVDSKRNVNVCWV